MSFPHVPLELRRDVRSRAREACEYCLLPESCEFLSHEIDHVIAQKHGGATTLENLALACVACNKHKGTNLATLDWATNTLVPLYHPRQQFWGEHFQLVAGRVEGVSAVGTATVRLLKMNEPVRLERRRVLHAAELIVIPGR